MDLAIEGAASAAPEIALDREDLIRFAVSRILQGLGHPYALVPLPDYPGGVGQRLVNRQLDPLRHLQPEGPGKVIFNPHVVGIDVGGVFSARA
jgi:hypothetical protein